MKVGTRVRSIDESCCNGHPEGTTGVITAIQGADIEVYGDTSYKLNRLYLDQCPLCLEVIIDGEEQNN